MALRELGRLERTLFPLQWLRDVELRRRIHAGLNKGEARNALAKAVFFNRLGELRDRTYENQRHRASGLNLVVAAIVLWNTVYLDPAVGAIRERGHTVRRPYSRTSRHSSWEHINLTGDYHWRRDGGLRNRKLRPLRSFDSTAAWIGDKAWRAIIDQRRSDPCVSLRITGSIMFNAIE